MKILFSVKAFEKLIEYVIETMIDAGYICEKRCDANEYVDMLINTETITDLQRDLLIEKIIDYSDELLDKLQ